MSFWRRLFGGGQRPELPSKNEISQLVEAHTQTVVAAQGDVGNLLLTKLEPQLHSIAEHVGGFEGLFERQEAAISGQFARVDTQLEQQTQGMRAVRKTALQLDEALGRMDKLLVAVEDISKRSASSSLQMAEHYCAYFSGVVFERAWGAFCADEGAFEDVGEALNSVEAQLQFLNSILEPLGFRIPSTLLSGFDSEVCECTHILEVERRIFEVVAEAVDGGEDLVVGEFRCGLMQFVQGQWRVLRPAKVTVLRCRESEVENDSGHEHPSAPPPHCEEKLV